MTGATSTATSAAKIELASRESGTLHVSLLWAQEADVFTVSVDDVGESFELVVEGQDALDVYYHPYAFAAVRGVEPTP
jgi:hypothetical protein